MRAKKPPTIECDAQRTVRPQNPLLHDVDTGVRDSVVPQVDGLDNRTHVQKRRAQRVVEGLHSVVSQMIA